MSFDSVREVSSCLSIGIILSKMILGELLASAGDDGNTLLWVPCETNARAQAFGENAVEDKETWRIKHMCRSSSGSEIYDLAWSPDGIFFITGSMDNIARIYNAQTGASWLLLTTCSGG